MRKLFFLIIIYLPGSLFAQVKFEKESRIKPRDVPAGALAFIDSLNIERKLKWFLEEGESSKSIEAKFKFNKSNYSVEFDTLGGLQDVEVEVDWKEIDQSVKEVILTQLQLDCAKFKINKIQKQYTGSEKLSYSIFNNQLINAELELKYEVVVRCNQSSGVELYEYLFDELGKKLSSAKIIFRNSSHLEY